MTAGQAPTIPHALIALANALVPAGAPAPDPDELLGLYDLAYNGSPDLPFPLLEDRSPCQQGLTPVELLQAGKWPVLRHCVGCFASGGGA